MSQPRLEVRQLSKTFGANRVLRDAAFSIGTGEVHGLVGQNGSGKSTIAKILSGFHTPDRGAEVLVDGTSLRLPVRPADMRAHGIAVVHQDLGLVERCTVVENIRLGSYGVNPLTRAIRWREERQLAVEAIARLGHSIDPDARIADLSAAERATVAIARAVQHQQLGQGLVMFDESTRALPRETLETFYALVRQIVNRGGSVLLVSHHLDEVLALTDRVTVLRDGSIVGQSIATSELDEGQLIELMLGRELAAPVHAAKPKSQSSDPEAVPAVEAHSVSGRLVRGIDLRIAEGEVVGVTGLVGSGYEELPYLLAGVRPGASGTLSVAGGANLDLARTTPPRALAAGIALVPERRAEDGLALSLSVSKNVTLPRVSARGSALRIGGAWQQEEARAVIEELGVRPADPDYIVGSLSGGNQQKVLLGKWLANQPRLLLLHEPTQGVDVGARVDLIAAVRKAATSGTGVIVAGLDPTELAAICDRVLVLRDGRIAHEFTGEFDADELVFAVYQRTVESMVQHVGGEE